MGTFLVQMMIPGENLCAPNFYKETETENGAYIISRQGQERTRLITMRSKPDYVEFVLL